MIRIFAIDRNPASLEVERVAELRRVGRRVHPLSTTTDRLPFKRFAERDECYERRRLPRRLVRHISRYADAVLCVLLRVLQ